jgi:HEAT repeat protein
MADPVGEALLRLREYARNRDIASLLREAQKSSGVSTVRSAAIHRLGNLRDPRALGAVAEIARSEKDHGLRVMAVRALGKIGGSPAIEPLIDAVDDPFPRVRIQAIQGLAKIGDRSAVPALSEQVRSSDDRLQREAARALSKIGGSEARSALTSAAAAQPGWRGRHLRRALRRMR